MLKKIMAGALTVAMLLSTAQAAFAGVSVKSQMGKYIVDNGKTVQALASSFGITLSQIPTSGEDYMDYYMESSAQPKTTVTVSEASAGSYSHEINKVANSDTVDYVATIDMSNVRKKFNDYITVAKSIFGGGGTALSDLYVDGQFKVTIDFPTNNFVPVLDDDKVKTVWDWSTTNIFNQISSTYDAVNGKVVLTMNVHTTEGELEADLVNKLPDTIKLACDGVNITSTGTYVVKGALEGYTLIGESRATLDTTQYVDATPTQKNDSIAYIHYGNTYNYQNSANTATVILKTSGGGGGGGSSHNVTPTPDTPPTSEPEAVVVVGTEEDEIPVEKKEDGTYVVNIDDIPEPEKEDFAFDGFSSNPALTDKLEGEVEVPEEGLKIYPRYVNLKVPEQLINGDLTGDENCREHVLYIVGYPDGEVKPQRNVSREEVMAAFYRLLEEGFRAEIETTENPFPDLEMDRWSEKSIATMANGGFVRGDDEGNVRPGDMITRGEFAQIASQFVPADAEPAPNFFSDIDDHWAKDAILKIAGQYWVVGYEDGTFRADAFITRAEMMTIINKMLVRYAEHDTVYAKQWPDLKKTDWYYDAVIEATTHNYYQRLDNRWQETWVDDAKTDTHNSVDAIMEDTYGDDYVNRPVNND